MNAHWEPGWEVEIKTRRGLVSVEFINLVPDDAERLLRDILGPAYPGKSVIATARSESRLPR